MSRTFENSKAKRNTLRKDYFFAGGKVSQLCKYTLHCYGDKFGFKDTIHKEKRRRYMKHRINQKLLEEIQQDIAAIDYDIHFANPIRKLA